MGDTEYFELCGISSKIQCLDCADCSLNWEVWHRILHLRQMHAASERNRPLNKARYDVWSIPGCVIKKNSTHGARHGTPMRQCMYYKAHEILKKVHKHEYDNILDRW